MRNDSIPPEVLTDFRDNYYFFQAINFLKLTNLFDIITKMPGPEKPDKPVVDVAHVKFNPDGTILFTIDPNFAPLQNRQALAELLIISGVSLFEKSCRDYFTWALKYYPEKMHLFGKKEMSLMEVIKSKDPKELALKRIVEDIKFIDTEECQRKFKDVFNVNVFETDVERYAFKFFIDLRHMITHNCGKIDEKFAREANKQQDIGKVYFITNAELKKFLDLLLKIREQTIPQIIDSVNAKFEKEKASPKK
jgi:hypothetical protein